MNIKISYFGRDNADEVVKEIREKVQATAMSEISWRQYGYELNATYYGDIDTGKLTQELNEIIRKYQFIRADIRYTYDVREGDGSAQWWGETHLYTEVQSDGTTKLLESCGTYWN